jgi:hypothetical protein
VKSRLRRFLGASLAAELAVVGVSFGAVVGAFVVTRAPLFNPPWTIDPWLYTALWVNFSQIYHHFALTYYASRIPWVIPGYLLNGLFEPRLAYYVLHGVFFFAGGLSAYLLFRRYLGRVAATVGSVWMLGNQMYFDAHHWDYWDGALITFIVAGLYFGLPRSDSDRPIWRPVLAGFFLAAAVGTNIYAIVPVLGLVIVYAVTQWRRPMARFLRRTARDMAAVSAGVALLFVGCAAFAHANGGPAWFLGPQITAARVIDPSSYKIPYSTWVPRSPNVAVPIILIAAVLLTLRVSRDRPTARRAGIAAAAYLSTITLFLWCWEVTGGALLEYEYYVSPLLPGMALCVAFVASAIAARLEWRGRAAVVGTAVLATLGPLLFIYTNDVQHRVGRAAYVPVAIFAAVSFVGILISSSRIRPPLRASAGVIGAAFVVASSAYALDANSDVFTYGFSSPSYANMFDLGMAEIRYLHETFPGEDLPAFWYDEKVGGGKLVGIQSLYYYGWTAIAFDLPKWDDGVEQRYKLLGQPPLVLLCETRECAGAPEVLQRHLPALRPHSVRRFVAGTQTLWIETFKRPTPSA